MRHIVVGVHSDVDTAAALDFAVGEAVRRRLPLQVLHAYALPAYGEVPPALFPDRLRSAREKGEAVAGVALEAAQERVPGGCTVAASVTVVEGDAATALLAAGDSAALLVVGRRGTRPLLRGRMGSVSGACLQRSRAPVAVVPESAATVQRSPNPRRVVIGLDGSPASLTALSWAAAQAREWGCPLVPVVVTAAVDRIPAGLRAEEQDVPVTVARLLSEAGAGDLQVAPRLVVGSTVEQLLTGLQPEDLLVVGSRGHRLLTSLLLGSTSLSVAERAPCTVVVVRVGQARREIHQRMRQESVGAGVVRPGRSVTFPPAGQGNRLMESSQATDGVALQRGRDHATQEL